MNPTTFKSLKCSLYILNLPTLSSILIIIHSDKNWKQSDREKKTFPQVKENIVLEHTEALETAVIIQL